MMASLLLFVLLMAFTNGFVHFSPAGLKPTTRLQAKTAPNKTYSRQDRRVASLMDWAESVAQIKMGGIQLKQGPAGLGWFATRSIPAGSVVLIVPSTVALTVTCPKGGPDDSTVTELWTNPQQQLPDMPWYVQMSLYLYKLKHVDSTKNNNLNLQTWLDSLPQQLDTPIHWDASTLNDELQYAFLVQAVQRQEEMYRQYHASLAGPQKVSWPDFLWGCEMARSRAFSGTYAGNAFNPTIYAFTLLLVTAYVGLGLGTLEQAANGAGLVLCVGILKDFVLPKLFQKNTAKYVICPMIDMANHQSTNYQGDVSFEYFGNSYSLAVTQPVEEGQQIYISYGTRSNDQLLQYYGFVEPDNPHDVYIMPPLREWDIGTLEQACGRTFAAGRLEKLNQAGLLGSTEMTLGDDDDDEEVAANVMGGVVLTRANGMDPAVMQALRALVSTETEWQAAGQAIGNFSVVFSQENEECARTVARKAVEMELASKATTLQQDQELLKRMRTVKSLDREQVLAVQFRIEKKKLLQETIQRFS